MSGRKKIMYIHCAPRRGKDDPQGSFRLGEIMAEVIPTMGGEDSEVEVYYFERGFHDMTHYHAQPTAMMLRSAYRAEKKRYDAAIIGSYLDYGLRECRSLVDIPVIGCCEASALMSHFLGSSFSVIAYDKLEIAKIRALLKQYGQDSRLLSIRDLDLTTPQALALCAEPEKYAARLKETALKLIREDYAEVIIPGSTMMSAICAYTKMYEIEGIPILDPVACAIKMAEVLVDMRRSFGLTTSREGLYSTRPGWEEVIPMEEWPPHTSIR